MGRRGRTRWPKGKLPFPPGSWMAELFDAISRLDREASGGHHRGQHSRTARDHLRTPQESKEGGNIAGSIGRLPFLTRTSVRSAASRALLRSHSGLNAGGALVFAPTVPTHLFRVLLLEMVLWLPRSPKPSWAPPSRMHPHWQTPDAGDPARADPGSSVS